MWNYFFIVRNSFNLKNEAAQHELNSIKNERRNIISLILKMKEGEVGHVFIVIYRFDCIEVDNKIHCHRVKRFKLDKLRVERFTTDGIKIEADSP